MLAVLRAPAWRQPATLQGAYAAVVSGQVRIIAALNAQIAGLHEAMAEHYGRHPDADIYLSQPGFAVVLAGAHAWRVSALHRDAGAARVLPHPRPRGDRASQAGHLRDHPMSRAAQSEEIASVALFLASDLASYVTGVTIPIGGGITAK